MSRPSTDPLWGTDSTMNDPGEDWDGTPTRVTPSSGERAAGVLPNQALAAQVFNFALGNHGDWIDYLYDDLWKYEVVRDHFAGNAVSTLNWVLSGSPTVVDDSSNGGHGALLLDGTTGGGSGQVVSTQPLAFGTGDFRIRFRLRHPSMTGTSVHQLGISKASTSKHLMFYALGSDSTTNWRTYIDAAFTSPNGTAATISSTYKDYEIKRVSGVVTFSVDGVALHTINSYTTDLSGGIFTLSALTSGNVRIDVAQALVGVW